MHGVPPPMTENYMPSRPDVEINYSKFTYGPKQTSVDESDAKTSEYTSCESDFSVETTTSMPTPVENAPKDDPHRALKDKEMVDSGCSKHMTRNKAYLADYQEFKGGSVAFGGRNGRITGKVKIKSNRLDFEDAYYVEELKHYNLFSVSQMCDKKNKVLFTDTDCLVLSLDFKLPDENQRKERKARTTLLMALPEDHLAKFHKIADAKKMWEAIKSRFCGNDKSKKMKKYLLKQQFKGHFARDCRAKGNQDNRRRDAGYNGNKARDNGRRPTYQDDSKSLVTIDGQDIDWSRNVDKDVQNYAMMAYSSSNPGSDNEDKREVVSKAVLYVAMELVHSDHMGSLVGRLVSSAILYGRCRAYEKVAEMKEPFDLSKVKGYRSSYNKDYTQASNNLATDTFPWLDEFVVDLSAPIEELLSKKPPSLQIPAPSRTQVPLPSS
nr:ribonuclease H-like domain-containing protein [Tanacetum cinerariifolium]